MDALRSNVWSSATLVEGFRSSRKQPQTFFVKTEEDQELVENFEARFQSIGEKENRLVNKLDLGFLLKV